MIRRIGYRTALTAFVFTGLWFVLGLLLVSSPIPGALGISGELFTAWLLLFLGMLGLSGLALFLAALNGIFPPNVRAPRRATTGWVATDTTLPVRPASPAGPRASRPPHGG